MGRKGEGRGREGERGGEKIKAQGADRGREVERRGVLGVVMRW